MTENPIVARTVCWDGVLPSRVSSGHVHFWSTRLDPERSPDPAHLSHAELQRAEKLIRAADRCRFVQSHAFLRRVLGRYLRTPPSEIEFAFGPQGKPVLGGALRGSGLEFNLSHCDSAAAVALAWGVPVGADVEEIRPMPDCLSVAKRFFAEGEYATLAALPETQRRDAFFRCWTRKEAIVKAVGLGLTMPLHEFEVALTAGAPAGIVSSQRCSSLYGEWSLIHFDLPGDVIGAVAVPLPKAVTEGFYLI